MRGEFEYLSFAVGTEGLSIFLHRSFIQHFDNHRHDIIISSSAQGTKPQQCLHTLHWPSNTMAAITFAKAVVFISSVTLLWNGGFSNNREVTSTLHGSNKASFGAPSALNDRKHDVHHGEIAQE